MTDEGLKAGAAGESVAPCFNAILCSAPKGLKTFISAGNTNKVAIKAAAIVMAINTPKYTEGMKEWTRKMIKPQNSTTEVMVMGTPTVVNVSLMAIL